MGRAAGPRGQLGKGLSLFLALISAMSVRGWGDARKSKILWISQKGKKKLAVPAAHEGTGTQGTGWAPLPSCPSAEPAWDDSLAAA